MLESNKVEHSQTPSPNYDLGTRLKCTRARTPIYSHTRTEPLLYATHDRAMYTHAERGNTHVFCNLASVRAHAHACLKNHFSTLRLHATMSRPCVLSQCVRTGATRPCYEAVSHSLSCSRVVRLAKIRRKPRVIRPGLFLLPIALLLSPG